MISFANSLGLESCYIPNTCTEFDYDIVKTPCSLGIRMVQYRWKLPKYCVDDNVTLPNGYNEDCSFCPEGYDMRGSGTDMLCDFCTSGT